MIIIIIHYPKPHLSINDNRGMEIETPRRTITIIQTLRWIHILRSSRGKDKDKTEKTRRSHLEGQGVWTNVKDATPSHRGTTIPELSFNGVKETHTPRSRFSYVALLALHVCLKEAKQYKTLCKQRNIAFFKIGMKNIDHDDDDKIKWKEFAVARKK